MFFLQFVVTLNETRAAWLVPVGGLKFKPTTEVQVLKFHPDGTFDVTLAGRSSVVLFQRLAVQVLRLLMGCNVLRPT